MMKDEKDLELGEGSAREGRIFFRTEEQYSSSPLPLLASSLCGVMKEFALLCNRRKLEKPSLALNIGVLLTGLLSLWSIQLHSPPCNRK